MPGRRHRDLNLRVGRLADYAARYQVFGGGDAGAPAHLLVDCYLAAKVLRGSRNRHRVRQRFGQRLLAEQVLAGSQGALGDRALMPGRHSDIHDHDPFVGQQRVKRFVDCWDAMIGGGLAGRLGIHIVAGQHSQPVCGVGRQVGVVHNPAAANDADAVVGLGRQLRAVVQLEWGDRRHWLPPSGKVMSDE
jgi:hypothetical protein